MRKVKVMKNYDVGMICGRFQTFHKGHESLVNTALTLCDRVLILVGSAQEHGTVRNPYDISTRIKMLREVYGYSDNIIIKSISDIADDKDWGKYLLNEADRYIYKAPELMIYGNDGERTDWFNPDDLIDTSELIINRGRIPISATMVREAMAFDRRREWMRMVNPKLHKMYDELRNELMEVDYYRELANRKED